MKKEEFQGLFKELIDILKVPIQDIAQQMKVSYPTAERWYKGLSAPHELGRKSVIKLLYIEQQRQEKIALVKKIIKEHINLSITEPNYFDSAYKIKIKFDDDVMAEDVFYIEKCDHCGK